MAQKRYGFLGLWMLLCSVTSAESQVSIGIEFPHVSIGINLPLYPDLVLVPGYPVYYAPQVEANYFFYDGMYWVYQNDNWYASSWYNGPWGLVEPAVVPLFILRVPVRYYRQPPVYFREWRSNAPPHWGEHWGPQWEQRRRGWDRWQRGSAPAPAPLPVYQRQYAGDRYPRQVEQQHTLRSEHYRYQPRDTIVRKHFQQQGAYGAPAPAQRGRQEEPPTSSPRQQDTQRPPPRQQGGPAAPRSQPPPPTPPQQRSPVVQEQRQQPGAAQREQQAPRSQGQRHKSHERGESQAPRQGRGHEQKKDGERDRERGH